jgi:hypothetical protein
MHWGRWALGFALLAASACSGDDDTGPAPAGTGGSSGGAAGASASSGASGASGSGGAAGNAAGGSAGGSAGNAGSASLPRHNERSPLGTNLAGIADWSGEWAFVDAFKMSRPWISGSSNAWDDGRGFDLDERGWIRSLAPGQIARTLMFWEAGETYPAGRYLVLYEGKGTLEYWAGASRNGALSSPGRDVLDVDPRSGGIGVNITALDAGDPLRNIRVIMPGGVCSDDPFAACESDADCSGACQPFEQTHATQIFHPTFLDRIKTYRLLRFMDWMETNDSDLTSWTDRPRVDDARWRRHGVPVEIMLDLANRLGADPWFCVPHRANDELVTELARAVHARLRPDLRAWVEYSNEVWNGMFEQARYAREQGTALGLSADAYQAGLFFYSRRATQVFARFEQVWGQSSGLVRVLASQSANPWTGEQVLEFEGAHQKADALAIAPYFGWNATPADAATLASMSLDSLVQRVSSEILPGVLEQMRANKATADRFGVRLVAYEGGQHFVGIQGGENDAGINDKFDALNRDRRMGDLYTTYLDGWKSAGGQDFAHFVNCGRWSKWGRWGALEWVSQPRAESPKYDALQRFIEAHQRWW